MKLTNAIKKLSKHGDVKQDGNLFSAVIGQHVVEFMANGRIEEDTNITCIRTRRLSDQDDSMTDYCGGVWCNNLSQAISLATT